MTIDEACGILNKAQHRGARSWQFNPDLQRVMPESWNLQTPEPPPCFTAFEAVTIARALVAIGALRTPWLVNA